jgi:Holliday junction resolvasome RuvABC endonuclease subunit
LIVLGLDPSGAFKEGKGTTGWCALDTSTLEFLDFGCLQADNYNSAEEYWDAHCALIDRLKRTLLVEHVVMEAFFLYANKAKEHINSTFETCQLIGIIRHHCMLQHIGCSQQRAIDVKNRWDDDVLEYKKIITPHGKRWMLNGTPINGHTLDAVRHATHYAFFGGKQSVNRTRTNLEAVQRRRRRYVEADS